MRLTLRYFFFLMVSLSGLLHLEAQTIPNADFENWTYNPSTGVSVPLGWSTSAQSGFTGGVDTSSLAHSGQLSAFIFNWYTYLPGALVNGNCNSCTNLTEFKKAGTPINSRPSSLSGYYHFELGNTANLTNDSAIVLVLLKKYNTLLNKIDTVGLGLLSLAPNTGFQAFTVPIHYLQNNVTPDSIVIGFFSNDLILHPSGGQRNNCSSSATCMYLKVDQLQLQGTTDLEEPPLENELVMPSPTPSQGLISFQFNKVFYPNQVLSIYDTKGSIIQRITGNGQQLYILNLSNVISGTYYYVLMEDNKQKASGKLVIQH